MAKQQPEEIIINIPEYNGAGIYKITNIVNGRVYIGSSKHIKNRLKAHQTAFRSGNCNSKFYEDIMKGHKFTAEVIEELPGIMFYQLRDKEEYYTKKYNSFHAGYNKAPVPTYDPKFHKNCLDRLLEKL